VIYQIGVSRQGIIWLTCLLVNVISRHDGLRQTSRQQTTAMLTAEKRDKNQDKNCTGGRAMGDGSRDPCDLPYAQQGYYSPQVVPGTRACLRDHDPEGFGATVIPIREGMTIGIQ